jgi:hypothetical protein
VDLDYLIRVCSEREAFIEVAAVRNGLVPFMKDLLTFFVLDPGDPGVATQFMF